MFHLKAAKIVPTILFHNIKLSTHTVKNNANLLKLVMILWSCLSVNFKYVKVAKTINQTVSHARIISKTFLPANYTLLNRNIPKSVNLNNVILQCLVRIFVCKQRQGPI